MKRFFETLKNIWTIKIDRAEDINDHIVPFFKPRSVMAKTGIEQNQTNPWLWYVPALIQQRFIPIIAQIIVK